MGSFSTCNKGSVRKRQTKRRNRELVMTEMSSGKTNNNNMGLTVAWGGTKILKITIRAVLCPVSWNISKAIQTGLSHPLWALSQCFTTMKRIFQCLMQIFLLAACGCCFLCFFPCLAEETLGKGLPTQPWGGTAALAGAARRAVSSGSPAGPHSVHSPLL